MPVEIRVPMMGESIVEATVGRWLKAVGDQIAAGEPVVELETDKVNLEVGAEQAGVLDRIDRQTGDTVKIGDVLGAIGSAESQRPPADTDNGQRHPAPTVLPVAQAQAAAAPAPAPSPAAQTEPPRKGDATPVARRVAQERGVDIAQVPGTGTGGRTTKDDVLRYAEGQPGAPGVETRVAPEQAAPAPPVAAPAATPPAAQPQPQPPAQAAQGRREERVRMTRRRQTIALRLVQAQQTAAMLTTFNEIDMSAIMDVRKRRKDAFKEQYGVGLGFMSFFTKGVIGALKAFPLLNAEIQGDPAAGNAEIVIKHYYDIGVAVSTPGGLVVPVLRDADRLSFAEIERGIGSLAERARGGTLTLEELRGGTFSITNGGIFGSLLSTPILNPPQVGILGMHKIQERPIAADGQVVVRPMMYVALTYDHRVVDGQEAVQFLVKVKELLEDPERLLLEG